MGDRRLRGFHELADSRTVAAAATVSRDPSAFTYTFENFFHPYVTELIEQVNKASVAGLLDPVFQKSLEDKQFFDRFYTRHDGVEAYPKDLDVRGGPYSNYNWELLFHVPVSIAVHLSNNQRFAEAQRWFHYIFDPTSTETPDPENPSAHYWRFIRFRKDTDVQNVRDLVVLLSADPAKLTADQRRAREHALQGLGALKRYPFEPHRVAGMRTVAYQYHVVMKYLDNLLAWGDSLFREDTSESVNEALQRYVLAANILGPRPQALPSTGERPDLSYRQMKDEGLHSFGNTLVELENLFPLNAGPLPPAPGSGDPVAPGSGAWVARTPYFCVPRNERLLAYWDRVEDRLLKIRNSMTLDGVSRQLALFEPAIDPGVLVRAAAAGVDVASALAGMSSPMGAVKAPALIRMAQEVCADVRNLGDALLGAIEKGEAEAIALVRQGHEVKVQERTRDARFLAWKQAQAATDALAKSRESAIERFRFYERLLGQGPDPANPPIGDFMSIAVPHATGPDAVPLLTEKGFDEAFAGLVAPFQREYPVVRYPQLKLAEGQSPTAQAGEASSGKLNLTVNEDKELNDHLPTARDLSLASSIVDTVASVLRIIPTISVDLHFWGLGVHSDVFGGEMLTEMSKIAASILRTTATWEQEQAGMAARTAGYERRADEWMLQKNLAARELTQIGRQLLASLVAEQAAHREYLSVRAQIDDAREVDRLLHEKVTGPELYGWMQGELTRQYYEHYRFAVDLARKAELTVKRELMQPELEATDFIKGDYWSSGRRGLLAAEGLSLDLRRLDLAYLESRRREYELVRHVSVNQLDPLALVQLRQTGTCEVSVPESVFDLASPGHYLRRIRKASLSIPAVTGPYTGVSCSLSLVRSSMRTVPTGETYVRRENDDRFKDLAGTVETIVTSTGREDDGLFDGGADDRPLPFEGAGAISTWRLTLPQRHRQFDYDSIADVVLHIEYTAREGGPRLRGLAEDALDELVGSGGDGTARLFSMRLEFPTEWARFTAITEGRAPLSFELRDEHYPYWLHGRHLRTKEVRLLARTPVQDDVPADLTVYAGTEEDAPKDVLAKDTPVDGLYGTVLEDVEFPGATGACTLHFDAGQISDLWLLVTTQGDA